METMTPHLDLIVRPLDVLDKRDDLYLGYDLSRVDVLQRQEMKRREYILREADAGAISFNEYREATGRLPVDSPLVDLLWMPSNKTPVVTTDGKTPSEVNAVDPQTSGGRPPGGVTEQPQNDPIPREDPRPKPLDNTPTTPAAQLSGEPEGIVTKEDPRSKEISEELWAELTLNSMNRLIERVGRVIAEKVSGQKFRKAFFSGDSTNDDVVASIYDVDIWSKQLVADLLPVAKSAIKDATGSNDIEITSIRGISLLNTIESTIKSIIVEERKKSKPDMQGLPNAIKNAIDSIVDSAL
jgi:hypothetical protein